MSDFNTLATDFLDQNRIAVVGVSRKSEQTANYIYRTLRDKGYAVYAINPNIETAEGDPCYTNIQAIPCCIDGAMIVTKPELTEQIVQDCAEAEVPRIWMHNNTFMQSSVSETAVNFCRDNNITVIAGGCPMMFLDFGHKCMRWMLGAMGRLPA